MANNRIYLRCRGCGAVLYLGKSFLRGYYYAPNETPLEQRLNEFYDRHNYCAAEKEPPPHWWDEEYFPLPDDCDGCDGSFDVVYEDGLTSGYDMPAKEDTE